MYCVCVYCWFCRYLAVVDIITYYLWIHYGSGIHVVDLDPIDPKRDQVYI